MICVGDISSSLGGGGGGGGGGGAGRRWGVQCIGGIYECIGGHHQ